MNFKKPFATWTKHLQYVSQQIPISAIFIWFSLHRENILLTKGPDHIAILN